MLTYKIYFFLPVARPSLSQYLTATDRDNNVTSVTKAGLALDPKIDQ